MENLFFRRQFLFSSTPTEKLGTWQRLEFCGFYLYVHPDCQLTHYYTESGNFALIGYFLNPHDEYLGNLEILKTFRNCDTQEKIINALYPLVGRFVLLAGVKKNVYLFNDACGLKTACYTKFKNSLYVASQPFLLKMVVPIEKESYYDEYFNSDYVKNTREHWLPCGLTLFKNVSQLIPNHYLDLDKGMQIRYWPNHNIKKLTQEEGLDMLAKLLQSTIRGAEKRFDLSMAVTAGMDSRILLAASKEIASRLYFYTLKYRNLDIYSPDISISKKLVENLGFEHHILDCTGEANSNFMKIYADNSPMAHLNDWGRIAYGIFKEYPENRVALRANCVEIARNYLTVYKELNSSITVDKILMINNDGWKKMEFIHAHLQKWITEVKDIKEIDLSNLYYWEHRMGSWQAQSQLEWDIVQEIFTPFNNRQLIEVMLGVDENKRIRGNSFPFFEEFIERLWPELLKLPINPKTYKQKLKIQIKSILRKMGLWDGL